MPAGAINRPQISLIVLNDFYLRGRSSVRYTVVIQKILQALHAMFCEAIHAAKGFCKKKKNTGQTFMKTYHYAVNKTLMEYTGLMNLMPFLAFQISFSETQKKCSENSLEVETLSKTYLIVSIMNRRIRHFV